MIEDGGLRLVDQSPGALQQAVLFLGEGGALRPAPPLPLALQLRNVALYRLGLLPESFRLHSVPSLRRDAGRNCLVMTWCWHRHGQPFGGPDAMKRMSAGASSYQHG